MLAYEAVEGHRFQHGRRCGCAMRIADRKAELATMDQGPPIRKWRSRRPPGNV